jgi:hypothetical protein
MFPEARQLVGGQMRSLLYVAALAAAMGCAHAADLTQGPEGRWRGVGLQVDEYGVQDQWTVTVTIDDTGKGRIEYPSLSCGGTLSPLKARAYTFRETITHGGCVSGGTIWMAPLSGKTMSWVWTGEQTDYPEISASAILFSAAGPTS